MSKLGQNLGHLSSGIRVKLLLSGWGLIIQSGSEYRTHSKTGYFEGRMLNIRYWNGIWFSNSLHWNNRLFTIRPYLDHWNTGHVRYSDPHCRHICYPFQQLIKEKRSYLNIPTLIWIFFSVKVPVQFSGVNYL